MKTEHVTSADSKNRAAEFGQDRVMTKPKLYYFGQTSIMVFAILFVLGIAFWWADSLLQGLLDESDFVFLFISVLKFSLPLISPVGLIAGFGLMHQRNWARKTMSPLLCLCSILIVLLGGILLKFASSAPNSEFINAGGKENFMVIATCILLVQIGLLLWGAYYVKRTNFRDAG
jgi:hypothetical protein